MHDDFDTTAARDELDRLNAKKVALLNHCRLAIEADTDLNDAEKAEAIAHVSDGLDNAFFRSINSLEDDLWWHAASVSAKQEQADILDIRGRQV